MLLRSILLGMSLSIVTTLVGYANAQTWSPISRSLFSTATASIRDLSETDEHRRAIGDRLGLASQRSEVNLTVVNNPDHPPWEPDVLSISTNALVTSDVRPQGIVMASHVSGVAESIDIQNMRANSRVNSSIELQINEAFDGIIHLRRNGFANAVGATLSDVNGNEVWSLDAFEQSSLVFWNGDRLPGGTPVDVSWHFEPGTYSLTYGHSPQQVVGTLGPSSAMVWITPAANSNILGDLDRDGILTSFDIDLLTRAVQLRETQYANIQLTVDPSFDLNDDDQFDLQDRSFWIESILHTYLGDANLDGEFNSTDLIQVLAAGLYNDNEPGNSGWLEGDWNGDGDFDSTDLIAALQSGGYDQGRRAATLFVPEPTWIGWILIPCVAQWQIYRRRRNDERVKGRTGSHKTTPSISDVDLDQQAAPR